MNNNPPQIPIYDVDEEIFRCKYLDPEFKLSEEFENYIHSFIQEKIDQEEDRKWYVNLNEEIKEILTLQKSYYESQSLMKIQIFVMKDNVKKGNEFEPIYEEVETEIKREI